MSSQKGNLQRKRPQKHQNHTAWKSNNTNPVLKQSLSNKGVVCTKCLEILQWKIKYNKYKPLSKPKKCTKCEEKTIKSAYNIFCNRCAYSMKLCAKCGKEKTDDIVEEDEEIDDGGEEENMDREEEPKGIISGEK